MPATVGNGKICYIEIPTRDVERSARFYAAVFGWQSRTRGDGHLAFDDGVGQVSGTWVTGREPNDSGLIVYIMVANIHVTLDAIARHGGAIVEPVEPGAREVVALFRDPAGNVFGLYEERTLTSRP